jgi:DNA-binding transcriptional ArsR family regulator
MPENALFSAIADPTRRAIVQRVARGALSAGDLATGFRISRPAVARHVGVLKRAGLLRERREGRHRFYELNPLPLRAIDSWIEPYRELWRANLRNLKAFVEGR